MSFRENLSSSFKNGNLSNSELRPPSKAYENFFEGYDETRQGKKVCRTYTGNYYVLKLSRRRHYEICVLYVLLFAVAAALLVFSASRSIVANTSWYVTFPQALSILFLAWTALGLFRYFTAPEKMQVRQYRESVPVLRRGSGLSAISLGLLTISYSINSIAFNHEALIYSLFSVFATVAMLVINLVERRIVCQVLDAPEEKG